MDMRRRAALRIQRNGHHVEGAHPLPNWTFSLFH